MSTLTRMVVLVGCAALLASCDERSTPSEPSVGATPSYSAGGKGNGREPENPGQRRSDRNRDATIQPGGPAVVLGVPRVELLKDDVVASKSIGTLGGYVAIPGAGVWVFFPPGAVSAPTSISVRAVAGSSVLYEFEPHGLQFAEPVYVVQDLHGTAAWNNPTLQAGLEAGYLVNGRLDLDAMGWGSAAETLPALVTADSSWAWFPIMHFSGYLLASGRQSTR